MHCTNTKSDRKLGLVPIVNQGIGCPAFNRFSLKVGERVVIPFTGLARVSDIVTKKFDSSEGEFYVLALETMPQSKVFVAKAGVDLKQIRRPLDRQEAKKVFQILKDVNKARKFSSPGQHAYYEKLIDLIKHEGPEGLAKIVRHFYDMDQQSLINTKHIRKLVKFAFSELIAEVAVAFKVSLKESERLIDHAILSRRPKNWKPIGRRLEQMMITDASE